MIAAFLLNENTAKYRRTTMELHCTHCGADLTGEETYCPNCARSTGKKRKLPKIPIKLVLGTTALVIGLSLLFALLLMLP